jgi:DNA repair protein RadC
MKRINKISEIRVSYHPLIKKEDRILIRSSVDGEKYLRNVFPDLEHIEYFYILCLNRANQILGYHQISKGGISGSVVDLKVIFQIAVKTNSSALIVAHNHPSGNLLPSDNDIRISQKIKEAGKLLDITLLDSLIPTQDSYISLADTNAL